MSYTQRIFSCAIILAILASVICYALAKRLPGHMYMSQKLMDSYFGSDLPRSYANMTSRYSDFGTTFKHPLYGLMFLPYSKLLRSVFGISPEASVRCFLSANIFLWALALFACLYFVSTRVVDTCLYTLLALFCSSTWTLILSTLGTM
jgi:hypothetical protein